MLKKLMAVVVSALSAALPGWKDGAFAASAEIRSVDCTCEIANGAVTAKVLVTNLTDKVQRVSLSGTILDHAAGKTVLVAGERGVDGNDCNALNARNAAESGVVISGYKAKLKPKSGRTITVSETIDSPKPLPKTYDMKLILYDAAGPCDSHTESFGFKEPEKDMSRP